MKLISTVSIVLLIVANFAYAQEEIPTPDLENQWQAGNQARIQQRLRDGSGNGQGKRYRRGGGEGVNPECDGTMQRKRDGSGGGRGGRRGGR